MGNMEFSPGAFNVVPERVRVWLEFRAGDEDSLDRMEARVMELAHGCAKEHGVGLKVQPVEKALSVATSPLVRDGHAKGCAGLGSFEYGNAFRGRA